MGLHGNFLLLLLRFIRTDLSIFLEHFAFINSTGYVLLKIKNYGLE